MNMSDNIDFKEMLYVLKNELIWREKYKSLQDHYTDRLAEDILERIRPVIQENNNKDSFFTQD